MGTQRIVQCPGCDGRYRVSPQFAGRGVVCQQCGLRFTIAFADEGGPSPVAAPSGSHLADIEDDDAVLMLGRLAVRLNMLSESQLESAVAEQHQRSDAGDPVRLGALLVERGVLREAQLDYLVSVQAMKGLRDRDRRFGDLAVRNGLVSEEQIREALKRQKQAFTEDGTQRSIGDILLSEGVITQAQFNAVRAAQQRMGGAPEEEAPVAGEAPFRLAIAEDRSRADLVATGAPAVEIDAAWVRNLLAEHGVVHGIVDDEAIAAYLKAPGDEPWTVARADPAKPGRDGSVRFHFSAPSKVGRLTDNGHIDFRDHGEIPQVHEGDLLAEKSEPQPGTPGTDVCGGTLAPPKPFDPPLRAGRGAELAADGLTVRATTGGIASHTASGVVSVLREYRIDGDIGYETGHVEYDGDILIAGSVLAGFRVRGARLTAKETVKADVEVEGDVEIVGGIIGGHVRAGGSIKANYIRNARVEATGDVVVQNEIAGGQVHAGGAILGERCKVVESKLSARKGIRLNMIGADASGATRLLIGVDEQTATRRHSLERRVAELRQQREGTDAALETAREQVDGLGERVAGLVKVRDGLRREMAAAEEQLAALEAGDSRGAMLGLRMELLAERLADAERRVEEEGGGSADDAARVESLEATLAGIDENLVLAEQDLAALEERDAAEEYSARLEILGTAFPGTGIAGPHKASVLQREVSRSAIEEREHRQPDGTRYWSLDVAPLKPVKK